MDRIGIRQILAAAIGTAHLTAPSYICPMGLGDEAKLTRNENTQPGNNDEDFPLNTNYKAEWKSFQMSLFTLGYLIYFAKTKGADVEITTEKIGSTSYGGVYKFFGVDKFMGVDFEWMLGSKERFWKFSGEVSLPPNLDKEIVQSAVTNTPRNLNAHPGTGYTHRGVQHSLLAVPSYKSVQNPTGTLLCNGYEIVSRSYKISTVGDKLEFDRTGVNYLQLLYEITFKKNSAQDLLYMLNKNRYASLKIEEYNGNSDTIETHDFAEGVFYRKQDFVNGKTEGTIKATFKKNLPLQDITVDTNLNKISVLAAV